MIFKPQRLGNASLPDDELKMDKKNCMKFGPCGIGEKAIYLNSFYVDRCYYIPMKNVKRIFKRIAMSKGGFTGKGSFGTLPYLVVEYDNGKEKQCNFKHEEDVDRLLAHVEKNILIFHSIVKRRNANLQKKPESRKKNIAMSYLRRKQSIASIHWRMQKNTCITTQNFIWI